MEVKQIASMLNDIWGEQLGDDGLIAEDLGNIVSAGQVITGASTFSGQFENYAGKIVDKVGRTILVDRVFRASDLGIWRDSFSFGSVLEKIRTEVGQYKDNCEWDLAKDANSNSESDYNDNLSTHIEELFKFVPAKVQAKYFNMKTTFKTVISITEKQLRSAFRSAAAMGRFIAMIENRVSSKMEIAKDALQRRTLANLAAEHIYQGKQFVDLKALYTAEVGGTVPGTLAEALSNRECVRFIAKKISFDRQMMTFPSTQFSVTGEFYNHTPEELSRLIVLSDVDSALKFNLYGDTYNEEFVKLKNYKTVPFWQSAGDGMNILDRSALRVTTSASHGVYQGAIIGVLFDRDAAMICNEEPEVRAQYNPDGNFTNYFYCMDCSYFNDFDENAVVYTWGDVKIQAGGTPTKAKGTNNGTTAVTITAQSGSGTSLYVHVGDVMNIAPGQAIDATDTTTWASVTSGTKKDNLAGDVGDYVTIVEVDSTSKVVEYLTQYVLTAADIK